MEDFGTELEEVVLLVFVQEGVELREASERDAASIVFWVLLHLHRVDVDVEVLLEIHNLYQSCNDRLVQKRKIESLNRLIQ